MLEVPLHVDRHKFNSVLAENTPSLKLWRAIANQCGKQWVQRTDILNLYKAASYVPCVSKWHVHFLHCKYKG